MNPRGKRLRLHFILNRWDRRGAQLQLVRFTRSLPEWIEPSAFVLAKRPGDGRPTGGTDLAFVGDERDGLRSLVSSLRQVRPSVVVTMGLGGSLFWGRLLALAAGVPIVYTTLHTVENLHGTKPRRNYFELANRVLNTCLPVLFPHRRLRFLPNSECIKNVIRDQVGSYRIDVLYNGYLREEFDSVHLKASGITSAHAPSESCDGTLLTIVGALEPEKDHVFALRCLREVILRNRDAKLVIIGAGSLRGALERQVAESNLGHVVHFAGHLDQPDVLRFVRSSRALIMTSSTESFPNAAAEAQALGVPVVGLDVGGLSEIVHDDQTGYVVSPGDFSTFCYRVSQLLDNRELAERMGENARERFWQNFSMQRRIRDFVGFIEEDHEYLTVKSTVL